MARLGMDGIVYAGNHGMEIRGRRLHFIEPFAFLLEPEFTKLVAELTVQMAGFPHVRIEDNRLKASAHLRDATEDERRRAANTILSVVRAPPQLYCRAGRYTFDILPNNGWDKGPSGFGANLVWMKRWWFTPETIPPTRMRLAHCPERLRSKPA